MRRLVSIAVITAILGACGGSSTEETSASDTTGSEDPSTTGGTATSSTTGGTGTTATTTPTSTATSLGDQGLVSWECDDDGVICAHVVSGSPIQSSVGPSHTEVGIPGTTSDLGQGAADCLFMDRQLVALVPRIDMELEVDGLSLTPNAAYVEAGAFQRLQGLGIGLYDVPEGLEMVEALDSLRASGLLVAPNYVYLQSPAWKYGPSDADPEVLEGASIPNGTEDPVVRPIAVVDRFGTGSNFGPVGHGEFIASLIEAYGEGTPTVGTLDPGIIGTQAEAVMDDLRVGESILESVLDDGGLVNLSLGTYPCRETDPPVAALVALAAFLGGGDLSQDAAGASGTEVTAAAGNDSHRSANGHAYFFPAAYGLDRFWNEVGSVLDYEAWAASAFGGTVEEATIASDIVAGNTHRIHSVGALFWDGQEWKRSEWSNDAEIYAPGERIAAEVDLNGTAEVWVWSGTSFAAPLFAACLSSGGTFGTCGQQP